MDRYAQMCPNTIRAFALAGLVFFAFAGQADAACYNKKGDRAETIRESADGSGLIWEHKGKRVEFTAASAGTGIDARVAYDPNMNGFRYELVGDNLIFGGVIYVPGCK